MPSASRLSLPLIKANIFPSLFSPLPSPPSPQKKSETGEMWLSKPTRYVNDDGLRTCSRMIHYFSEACVKERLLNFLMLCKLGQVGLVPV